MGFLFLRIRTAMTVYDQYFGLFSESSCKSSMVQVTFHDTELLLPVQLLYHFLEHLFRIQNLFLLKGFNSVLVFFKHHRIGMQESEIKIESL